MIEPRKNQSGKRMWPFSEISLPWATWWSDAANLVLLVCLLGGVLATFVIIRATNVKEHHWENDRRASQKEIARLQALTAWRNVLPEQHQKLVAELSKMVTPPQAGRTVIIAWIKNDPESLWYSSQIFKVFEDAGWPIIRYEARTYTWSIIWGLRIPDIEKTRDAAPLANNAISELRRILTDADIQFSSEAVPPPAEVNFATPPKMTVTVIPPILVMVGSRPLPSP